MQIDTIGKVHSILQTQKIYFCDIHSDGDSTTRPPEVNSECNSSLQHGYYVYENTNKDVCIMYHTRCLCVRTFPQVFNETALQHVRKWLDLLQPTFPSAILVRSPQGRPYINLEIKNVQEDVSFFEYPLPTPHVTYQFETI